MPDLSALMAEMDEISRSGTMPDEDLAARLDDIQDQIDDLIEDLEDANTPEDDEDLPGDPEPDPEPDPDVEPAPVEEDRPLRIVRVTDGGELGRAIKNAKAGDRIAMANGEYRGDFTLTANGTAANRIWLGPASDAQPDRVRFTGGKLTLKGRFTGIERITIDRPFPRQFSQEDGSGGNSAGTKHYVLYLAGNDQVVRWCSFKHIGGLRVKGWAQRFAIYANSFVEPGFNGSVSHLGVEIDRGFPAPRFGFMARNYFFIRQNGTGETFCLYHGKNSFGLVNSPETISATSFFAGNGRRGFYSKGSKTHLIATRCTMSRGYHGWRNGVGGLMAGNISSLPLEVDGAGRTLIGNRAPSFLLHGGTNKPGQLRAATNAKMRNNHGTVKVGFVGRKPCVKRVTGLSVVGQPKSDHKPLNASGTKWVEAEQPGLWVPTPPQANQVGRSTTLATVRADIQMCKRLGLTVKVSP